MGGAQIGPQRPCRHEWETEVFVMEDGLNTDCILPIDKLLSGSDCVDYYLVFKDIF